MEARGCWCSVPARVAGALGLNPFRPQIFDIPEKHLENERRKAPRLVKKNGERILQNLNERDVSTAVLQCQEKIAIECGLSEMSCGL